MGWSGGSDIATSMIEVIKSEVTDTDSKRRIYKVLLDALQDRDWDTEDEARGIDPVFDELLPSEEEY